MEQCQGAVRTTTPRPAVSLPRSWRGHGGTSQPHKSPGFACERGDSGGRGQDTPGAQHLPASLPLLALHHPPPCSMAPEPLGVRGGLLSGLSVCLHSQGTSEDFSEIQNPSLEDSYHMSQDRGNTYNSTGLFQTPTTSAPTLW